MKKSALTLGFILCAAVGMAACSSGEYNDLECDPADYQAECLGPNSYMYCKGGKLISVVCGGNRVCKSAGDSVGCQYPADQKPADAALNGQEN